MKNIKLDRPLTERGEIYMEYKFFKVAHLRELEQMVSDEEITYSRMVELINELAYDFYVNKPNINECDHYFPRLYTTGQLLPCSFCGKEKQPK